MILAMLEPARGAPADSIPIVLKEWSISKPITTNAGEIAFDIKNAGTLPHDFVIADGKEVWLKTVMLNPGFGMRLRMTLPPGKYTLYCDVPGHQQLGMVSTLEAR